MALSARESIPEDVLKQLRREAGFGCCFCGNPIIQYHHIRPYTEAVASEQPPHVPEDMMVVCPTHHQLITTDSIGEDEQRRAKARPLNISRGFVHGRLYLGERVLRLSAGSTDIRHWFAFVVDDLLLLALTKGSDGNVEVTLRVHDDQERPVVRIVRNVWLATTHADGADVKFQGRRLRVRRPGGELALEVDASRGPTRAVVLRGHVGHKGGFLMMSGKSISLGSRTTTLNNMAGMHGIGVHVNSSSQAVGFFTDPGRVPQPT